MTTMISRRRRRAPASTETTIKHAAIYARLSVTSEAEISSVDVQVEGIRAYVKSRAADGWELIEPPFIDDGFSAGTADDRPALQRLLHDVEAGVIQVVVVTRVDRLSRNQRDFVRIMETFERHGTAFVATLQSFDTSTSMGKFCLNMLMNFAEFERSVISERTRDKIAFKVKAGGFHGSRATLGYRLEGGRLVVDAAEAEHVRLAFEHYRVSRSVLAVAEELNRREIRTKAFTRRDGSVEGGRPWSGEAVHRLLTNAVHCGFVKSGDQVIRGIHEAIVDESVWRKVQSVLKSNNSGRWRHDRRNARSLLQGFVWCSQCGGRYLTTFSGGARKYGSYLCSTARQRGADACKQSRVPLTELDNAVLNEIRAIGRDPTIFEATLRAAREAAITRKPELEAERDRLDAELRKLAQSRAKLVDAIANGASAGRDAILRKLGEIDVENDKLSRDLERVREELRSLENTTIDEAELRRVLAQFDDAWDALVLEERRRLLALLIERIEYDGQKRLLRVRFRANGLSSIASKGDGIHE